MHSNAVAAVSQLESGHACVPACLTVLSKHDGVPAAQMLRFYLDLRIGGSEGEEPSLDVLSVKVKKAAAARTSSRVVKFHCSGDAKFQSSRAALPKRCSEFQSSKAAHSARKQFFNSMFYVPQKFARKPMMMSRVVLSHK